MGEKIKKIIIALTGASGINYGIEFLKELKGKAETHLILSEWAEKLIKEETEYSKEEILKIADFVHGYKEMDSIIASSSFKSDAMIIIPATIKTVSGIANAQLDNLITRTADNTLKMKKKLIICIRETPLSVPALEQMHKLGLAGAIVLPLSPGFYHKPKTIKDLTDFITVKIFDLLEIESDKIKRWKQ